VLNPPVIAQNQETYVIEYCQLALKEAAINAPDKERGSKHIELLDAIYHVHRLGGSQAVKKTLESFTTRYPSLVGILRTDSGVRFYHITELNLLPSVQYLYKNEIPAHGLTVLYGASGAGKSFVAIDYGLRIAKDHTVLYFAPEGQSGYDKRTSSWCQHHNVERNSRKFYLYPDAINVLDEQSIQQIIAQARPFKPDLIVLDPLASFMIGGDENMARDVTLFLNGCHTLQRELGAAILLVHHTGKTGSSERGSSALRAASDMMIALQSDGSVIKLKCAKSKDDKPFADRHLALREIHLGDGITSCVAVPTTRHLPVQGANLTDRQWTILEAIGQPIFHDAGAKKSEICKATGLAESTVYRNLSALKVAGYISQSKKGDPFKIAEEGRNILDERDNDYNEEIELGEDDV
jgi:hypothetical protein